jgi:hypothetical protein
MKAVAHGGELAQSTGATFSILTVAEAFHIFSTGGVQRENTPEGVRASDD